MEKPKKDLSLDFYKNNSHKNKDNTVKSSCHVGYFQGVYRTKNNKLKGIRTNIRCNMWSCEFCRPRKIKKLKKRCYSGNITKYANKKGFRSKYSYKMLTLTVPGKAYRSEYTPSQALEHLSKNTSKLIKALKRKFGKEFHTLRVAEPQKDGFPHYHILMIGHSIATKHIYEYIEKLWIDKYNMGFFWLNLITKGIGGGINYIMKYLTKEIQVIKAGMRIFTTSKNAIESIIKIKWIRSNFYQGIKRGQDDNTRHYEMQLDINLSKHTLRKEVEAFIMEVCETGIRAPF